MSVQQQGTGRPPRGPYHPYTLPRPPAPPSTGQGWVVVALLTCWPFALAALPHTLRASRALGAGDERTAAAEGARAQRFGIWGLAVGLSLSTLIVVGYLVAMLTVMVPIIGAETDGATPVTEPAAGSGPEDGTPVRETWDGNCYGTEGLTEVVARVEILDCDEPHGGEMYFEVSLYTAFADFDSPLSLPYPGETELARHAAEACAEKLGALRADPEAFDIWYITPTPREWSASRNSLRCFAEARDGSSTGSIAERASDE